MNKKKILITGKNSYIGANFVKWLQQWIDQYEVFELSVRGEGWKTFDFSAFDVVLHVAGIAHISTDPKLKDMYYLTNRDLTIEIAKKAKTSGVKQFIFLSSIIVYGNSKGNNLQITKGTSPNPANFYGDSKLQAEDGIRKLTCDLFKVVIIRPPMVYGRESKGNYAKLSKVARNIPVFPDIKNQRSMIYIDNLCEFIKLMIDNHEQGLFFPQNSEYTRTSEIINIIAAQYGKRVRLIKGVNGLIKMIFGKSELYNKVFGNLTYDKSMSYYSQNYQIKNLHESIMETEKS